MIARLDAAGRRLELLGSAGATGDLAQGMSSVPLDSDSPLARAALEGAAVAARGGLMADALSTGRVVVLPLIASGRAIGVVGFDFSTVRAGSGELERLQGIASEITTSLQEIAASLVHDRAERLQRVTALTAAVRPRTQIAAALLDEAMAATGAESGAVALLDEERGRLRIVSFRGYTRERIAAFDPLPLDVRAPLSDAALYGTLIIVETGGELDEHYPDLLRSRGHPATEAVVGLPLAAGRTPFGAIALSFPAPRFFDHEERAFMLALARLCAQAVDRSERAYLYDRLARLQAVTAALAGAATPADVGRVIVKEAIAALGADDGRVALMDPATGAFVTIAASDAFARIETRLRDIGDLDAMPLAVSARHDEVILIESLEHADERWAVAAAQLTAIGQNAVAVVPLRSGDGVVGAIGFTWRDEQRHLGDHVPFLRALAGVCAQAIDRTRLYDEAERSRRLLRHLFDRLDESVLVLDNQLRITYANREAAQLFGRRTLVGSRLPNRWPELRLRELARLVLEPDAQPVMEVAALDDGRTFDVIGLPDRTAPMLVVRDISRRERLERAEREFVANAAHELRSPLAAIGAAVDALQLGAKQLPAERDFYISGIAAEVERLTRLSEALLLLARAQSGADALALEPVEIEPLLTGIAAGLQVRPGVRVLTDCNDCTVLGDQTLLHAAIANVAQNASRHTSSGSITLGCACEDSNVVIHVSDTGDGMDHGARTRAAERFFRASNRTRDGFGLGLSLVKQMVEALGGELEIGEARPSGTTVTIRLPRP